MYYRFATLDPRPADAARAANDAVFAAGPVYGLEVTVPALAERCTANLDPQHIGGDAGTAAIQAALDWPLPPHEATLATVRPDADSIGAMAVLLLRREQLHVGYEGETLIDTVFHVGERPVQGIGIPDRAAAIAAADKEASGPWPGPRPVGDAPSLLRDTTPLEGMCMDHRLTVQDRVARMRDWLLTGTFAGMDGYRERALKEAEEALATLQVQVHGNVAVVTGSHRLAMSLGYRHAPVVVATNPAFRFAGGEPHVKHTIARWNTGTLPDMDWAGMLSALSETDPAARLTPAQADAYHQMLTRWVADVVYTAEAAIQMDAPATRKEDMPVPPAPPVPRWGGSTSIAGSPQGVDSGLTTQQVAEIVAAHL